MCELEPIQLLFKPGKGGGGELRFRGVGVELFLAADGTLRSMVPNEGVRPKGGSRGFMSRGWERVKTHNYNKLSLK